jgi:hypothetical protein
MSWQGPGLSSDHFPLSGTIDGKTAPPADDAWRMMLAPYSDVKKDVFLHR